MLFRSHTRAITQAKLDTFQREQRDTEQGGKQTGRTSGDFADAIRRAAKQEINRGGKDRGPDRGLDR